ncbi:MAG: TldD/PmbA family protein [Deltaproteobacteria bacterium]|nr:MAG: TldD/PmbA family protein [Deltaproteobacteria bacterium]
MVFKIDFARILKENMKYKGEFSDIFAEYTHTSSIVYEENRLEKVISGIDSGVGIRTIYNKHTAYGYTNDISQKSLLELANVVGRAAGEGSTGIDINLEKKHVDLGFKIKLVPEDVPIERKVDVVKRANEVAWKYDSRVRQVKVTYLDRVQFITVANSDGSLAEETRFGILFAVQVVASKDNIIQTGYEPIGGFQGFEIFDENPPEEIAEKAAKRAILMLESPKAPAGKMPVILDSEAGGTMIHEAVGHGLEADLAQEGLSVYSGKIGETVASPLITVIDDATLPYKRGSYGIDDEGTPARCNVLVEKGVLKGYMYDRLTALKDGRESTGNGRRESYRYRPIPRMSNTYIAPGETDPATILKETDRGLFVKKMGGGQVDTVSGNFVFEVSEGYKIENGEMAEPVRGAVLTGNGPEVLRIIDRVGNDLGFAIGTCGKDGQGVPVSDAQPTLRIPEIVVGGENK